MRTTLLDSSLPYIMDLETGISSPRERASGRANPDSSDVIRRRAYLLWEAEGHPDNRGIANWLDAETQQAPTSPLRVKAIPAVRLEPLPAESSPCAPSEATGSGPAPQKATHDGPSPLCREAVGDDLRDYAFHLYLKGGCNLAKIAECWAEAKRCLDARKPAAESFR